MMGGYGPENPIDAKVMSIACSMKPQIEAQLGRQFSIFVPVSYSSQLVAGLNYKIRVAVDGGQNVYVTVYEELPCNGSALSLTEATLA